MYRRQVDIELTEDLDQCIMFEGGVVYLLADQIETDPLRLHREGGVKDADAIGGLGLKHAEADIFCLLEGCYVTGETNDSVQESSKCNYLGVGHVYLSEGGREERGRMRVKEKERKRRAAF